MLHALREKCRFRGLGKALWLFLGIRVGGEGPFDNKEFLNMW